MTEACPWCGSTALDAHFVDIGVGIQQATPFQCLDCRAQQMSGYDDNTEADPEEYRKGWYKGNTG